MKIVVKYDSISETATPRIGGYCNPKYFPLIIVNNHYSLILST